MWPQGGRRFRRGSRFGGGGCRRPRVRGLFQTAGRWRRGGFLDRNLPTSGGRRGRSDRIRTLDWGIVGHRRRNDRRSRSRRRRGLVPQELFDLVVRDGSQRGRINPGRTDLAGRHGSDLVAHRLWRSFDHHHAAALGTGHDVPKDVRLAYTQSSTTGCAAYRKWFHEIRSSAQRVVLNGMRLPKRSATQRYLS